MVRPPNLSLRLALLIAICTVVTITIASPAEAARRSVPFGFFGTVDAGLDAPQVSDATLDQQMALMASSGVEIVRLSRDWGSFEPARGVYTWGGLDRFVAAAARHRLTVLLNIWETPRWASPKPNAANGQFYPPKDPNDFAEFMRQAVLRYGPGGSFWTQNKSLPRVPVREWQIWNEESARFFWVPSPWAPGYAQLLKKAYVAIHRADHGAKVVAGSLVGAPESPWNAAADLYRAGAKRYFDVIAVHPFTNNPKSATDSAARTLEIARFVRAVMNKHGDSRKPIIITEMTWTAALGHVPNAALLGFETTPGGQAARLQAAYRQMAAARRKLNITQAFWFTWASDYSAGGGLSVETFRFSGLTRIANGTYIPLPLLKTYANVAAQLEGCRKSSDATRCLR
jgi:polysaccharide biosynthesis protein PslG